MELYLCVAGGAWFVLQFKGIIMAIARLLDGPEAVVAEQNCLLLRRPADWSNTHMAVLIPCDESQINLELLGKALRRSGCPKLMFYPKSLVPFRIIPDSETYQWVFPTNGRLEAFFKASLVRMLKDALSLIQLRDQSESARQWIGIINEDYWPVVCQSIQKWLNKNGK